MSSTPIANMLQKSKMHAANKMRINDSKTLLIQLMKNTYSAHVDLYHNNWIQIKGNYKPLSVLERFFLNKKDKNFLRLKNGTNNKVSIIHGEKY